MSLSKESEIVIVIPSELSKMEGNSPSDTKIVSKINTYKLFWKQSENIWGTCLPNFNI